MGRRDLTHECSASEPQPVLRWRRPVVHLAGCCLALLGLTLCSCNPSPREASRPTAQILPPLTASQIASRLDVTRAESDSAIGSVLRSAVPPDTAVGYRVVLWEFRDRTRYLILAYLRGHTPAGHYRPALYAIEDGRVSAPYAFKDNERVTVRRIADFDHDAVPDVALCVSLEAREEVVVARVAGYREGSWYLIAAASSAIPLCTSAALSWSP